jgi:PAS domain S-box-containing protein
MADGGTPAGGAHNEAPKPAPGDLVAVLLDSVGVPVVVLDRDGRVVRFNQAAQDLSGYTLDDVRGKPLWEHLLPAEEVDGVRIACEQVFGGRHPLAHEHTWLLRDGSRRTMSGILRGLTDPSGAVACVVFAGQDVTERRIDRAEQDTLVASEALFRSVLEHSPTAVLVCDAEGRLVMANGPAQEWLGLPPEAVGTALSKWVKQAGELLSPAPESGRQRIEVDLLDGKRRTIGFRTVACPVTPQGGWITVFRDIGEFRRGERRRKRAERLAQARTLAVGLGEQLQTPLASLLAGVQFLEQEPSLAASQHLVVVSLGQAARRLTRATQEFLDSARASAITARLVPLGKMMAEAMDPYVGLAATRQVKLEIIAANGDAQLAVDPAAFRRAVGGIVENAIEAAGRDGHVRVAWLELPPEEVPRRLFRYAGTVAAIRITDDGPGMDEDDLRKVFRPFSAPRDVGGGLGLPVAQEIIESHGGLLGVTSRKGGETTFEILLPSGERVPCWQTENRPQGICGVCAARTAGGYCCWAVTGHAEYVETGLWPAKCAACPIFRRHNLGLYVFPAVDTVSAG